MLWSVSCCGVCRVVECVVLCCGVCCVVECVAKKYATNILQALQIAGPKNVIKYLLLVKCYTKEREMLNNLQSQRNFDAKLIHESK